MYGCGIDLLHSDKKLADNLLKMSCSLLDTLAHRQGGVLCLQKALPKQSLDGNAMRPGLLPILGSSSSPVRPTMASKLAELDAICSLAGELNWRTIERLHNAINSCT
jgi:hypothetical protein